MATIAEFNDFRNKLNSTFTTGLLGQFMSAAERVENYEGWTGDIRSAMRNLDNLTDKGTDTDRDRAIEAMRGTIKKNSNDLYSIIGTSRAAPDLKDQLNSQLQDLSSVSPNQYVNPADGSGGGTSGPYVPSTPTPSETKPPTTDEQAVIDKAKIEEEGKRQYGQQQDLISSQEAQRAAARDQLGKLLTQQATTTFGATLPNIAEDAQAAHLYDSTGYGQEVARQQAQLASGIANQLGQTGLQDVNLSSQAQAAALQGLQGYQGQGLERTFNLQDYQRQADLARQIGAASVPQVRGTGKAGSALGGAASGAATGATVGGVPGAIIGGVAGLGLGSAVGGK